MVNQESSRLEAGAAAAPLSLRFRSWTSCRSASAHPIHRTESCSPEPSRVTPWPRASPASRPRCVSNCLGSSTRFAMDTSNGCHPSTSTAMASRYDYEDGAPLLHSLRSLLLRTRFLRATNDDRGAGVDHRRRDSRSVYFAAGIAAVGTITCAYGVPFHITHGPPVCGSVGKASSALASGRRSMMCAGLTTH